MGPRMYGHTKGARRVRGLRMLAHITALVPGYIPCKQPKAEVHEHEANGQLGTEDRPLGSAMGGLGWFVIFFSAGSCCELGGGGRCWEWGYRADEPFLLFASRRPPQATTISVGKSRWVFEWEMCDSGLCVAPICCPCDAPPGTPMAARSCPPLAVGSLVAPPPASFGSAPPRAPPARPAHPQWSYRPAQVIPDSGGRQANCLRPHAWRLEVAV
jgi:hypothetical protein